MKKGLIIALIAIAAFAALGVGYGAWAKSLNVVGTITTGDTSAQFSTIAVPSSHNLITITAVANPTNSQEMDITITNAYPGMVLPPITYFINNNGTVPMKATGLTLVSCDGNIIDTGASTFTAPADSSIAPMADSVNQGQIGITLLSDDTKIIPNQLYNFTLRLDYTDAIGP